MSESPARQAVSVVIARAPRAVFCALLVFELSACARLGLRRPEPVVSEAEMRFPRDAARFELQPLTDSTVAFVPAEAKWVRTGTEGIAVDPARGDALIARLRVTDVSSESATAFVTGQTTRVAAGHVLLLVPPVKPWWRRSDFWWGVLSGAGIVTGVVSFL